jgi:hypothetical protein
VADGGSRQVAVGVIGEGGDAATDALADELVAAVAGRHPAVDRLRPVTVEIVGVGCAVQGAAGQAGRR